MAKLLKLESGSSFDPGLVAGVVKFPKKGVVMRNEYNKIIVFEPETDAERQQVIADVISDIVNSDREWTQPDWKAEFAKVSSANSAAKPLPTSPVKAN